MLPCPRIDLGSAGDQIELTFHGLDQALLTDLGRQFIVLVRLI